MKKKTGFITNSSSVSFILYVESDEGDLSVFEKKLKEYIEHENKYEYGAGTRHSRASIRQISSSTYKVEEYTHMFNGFEDVPSYMIDLIIKANMSSKFTDLKYSDLPEFIKNVKFEINED